MINFKFNMFDEIEYPTIILSTKYHKHLGVIENIDMASINGNFNMASPQELSFDVYKETDGKKCSLWEAIVDFKYIFVPEFQEYYEIKISLNEDDKTVKHIVATSACEAELSTRLLRNFECNSETDILRDDYIPTVLYNPDKPDASLLNRVLKDKCPDYTIAHVDASIASIQRTFSIDNEDIYTFFTSTVAKEIECLFVFDSVNRTISVYDLKNSCLDCGQRFDDGNICPECGSKNIKNGYGENTSVYVSAENYAELITVEGNSDNVFNCLRIEGGDDLITATVANINPNGSNYIYQYQQNALDDMPEYLVNKINEYNTLYNSKKPVYEDYTKKMYETIDEELYLTSEMMPEIVIPTTTAQQELSNLLTQLSEVAVTNISVISKASSDIAVKGMAKVIVDARYDVEIISSSLSDLHEGTYRTWTGKYKIINKGNEEDIAESISLSSVKIVGNNYEEYLYQKIQKTLDKENSTFHSIFEIEDIELFKTELKKYCLDRLKSFESSYQTCLEVLIENGVTDKNSVFYDVDLYNSMYLPYYQRIVLIQAEMVVRESQISKVHAEKEKYDKLRKDIQKELNFKDYLGNDLWLILSHYLREDTYSNSNYISKGLNNADIIKKASELYTVANDKLNKASKLQFNLTSTLLNLLNTKEFEPFKNKISLGNWINVRADDVLYQLRLINLSVDYGNLKNISVTFSNVIKSVGIVSDAQSILNQAKSMAVSYDYVAHQANQGNEAQKNVETWIEDGLNSSLVQIKNNNKEEITYDNHGLWARSWDDITESYLPEQLRITSNILAFTKDNWLTCSAALGKHNYRYYDKSTHNFVDGEDYGLSAQFVQAGHIYGTQIIGGDIYSDNYSSASGTYINLRDGSFSFAGGKLKFQGDSLTLDSGTFNGGNFIGGRIYSENYSSTSGTLINLNDGTFSFADGKLKYDGDTLNITDNFIVTSDGELIVKGETYSYNTIYMYFNKIYSNSWDIEGFCPIIKKQDADAEISFGLLDNKSYIKFNKHYGLSIRSNGCAILGEEYGLGGYVFCYLDLCCEKNLQVLGTLYTTSGTVSSSDKKGKNSILPLSKNDSANFIYSLTPSQYKLNDGTSNRYHHGFIAQEVKDAMGSKDWGVYVDTSITNDSGKKESFKALRYEELIADLVATVQSQNERISLLEHQLIER